MMSLGFMGPASLMFEEARNTLMLILAFAMIFTILLYVFILPDSKYNSLNPFLRWVHEFFKVKKLWIESIVRFFYVYGCLFYMVGGIYVMFKFSFWAGFCMFIFAPIVLRLLFEFLMMMILIARNVMELNNKTPYPDGAKPVKPAPPVQKTVATPPVQNVVPTPPVQTEAPAAPAPKAPAAGFCTKCGAKLEEGSKFCTACGNKIG